ncbi:MAG: AcvB/VirJ family lysyl-phosphatidylglycerol hydrolase [Ferruginibacter sp.]
MNKKKLIHNSTLIILHSYLPQLSLKLLYILFLSCCSFISKAQTDFEIKEWTATTTDKPMLFYISGDGGFNSFSSDLCSSIHKQGYNVIALNAKKYFWDKKTPEQTATDIENYLIKKIAVQKNKHVSIIGYSFGADVLPFLLTRFSASLNQNVTSAIIMAPSGSTDFEIHWADMFGNSKKREMDVVSEMNKIKSTKLIHISGDEDLLDESKIILKNYIHEILPGGHHFDGNIDELTKTILKYTN